MDCRQHLSEGRAAEFRAPSASDVIVILKIYRGPHDSRLGWNWAERSLPELMEGRQPRAGAGKSRSPVDSSRTKDKWTALQLVHPRNSWKCGKQQGAAWTVKCMSLRRLLGMKNCSGVAAALAGVGDLVGEKEQQVGGMMPTPARSSEMARSMEFLLFAA